MNNSETDISASLRRLAITPSPGRIINIWKRHRLIPGPHLTVGGQNEFDRTHNCGCPALPQRAILILHRALHNPPSVWNRSVEHCLGRHVMPSKTNPCLGASHDRKLASFRKNAPMNPTIHFRRSEASIAISFSVKTFCTKVSTTIITGYPHFDLVETRLFLTSSYESNRNTRLAD